MTATLRLWKDFYPRPPRGGRRLFFGPVQFATEFLSTPSARRATGFVPSSVLTVYLFLSTPSARRATLVGVLLPLAGEFLSTPSARRATSAQCS